MQSTITFRQFELLVPLVSNDTFTEHLVRKLPPSRDGSLYRLRLGRGARAWCGAPEVGVRVHPHVLAVLESGVHEGVDYVVYEHVHGVQLSEVLRSRAMTSRPECAVSVVLDGLRASQAYRAWRFESREEGRSNRRPIGSDDVWIGVDGITRLSIVDLPSDDDVDDEHACRLDVRAFGAALHELVAGGVRDEDELGAYGARNAAIAEVCARAIGLRDAARYGSSGEMSLALHRLAVAERLMAPVEAVGSLVSLSFSDHLAAAVPPADRTCGDEDDEPTVIGPRALLELDDRPTVVPPNPARFDEIPPPPSLPTRVGARRTHARTASLQLVAAALLGACVAAWTIDPRASAGVTEVRPSKLVIAPTPSVVAAPPTNETMVFSIDEVGPSPRLAASAETAPETRPDPRTRRATSNVARDRAAPRNVTNRPQRASIRPRSSARNPYL